MSKSSGDFVAGFFFGAFVGALLALLFAPTPGEELRGQLKERSIELRDRAEELGEEANRLVQENKSRFQEAIDEGRKAAERKKSELMAQLEGEAPQGLDLAEPEATEV